MGGMAVLHSWTLSESYGEGHLPSTILLCSGLPRVPQGGVHSRLARSARRACRAAFHCDEEWHPPGVIPLFGPQTGLPRWFDNQRDVAVAAAGFTGVMAEEGGLVPTQATLLEVMK